MKQNADAQLAEGLLAKERELTNQLASIRETMKMFGITANDVQLREVATPTQPAAKPTAKTNAPTTQRRRTKSKTTKGVILHILNEAKGPLNYKEVAEKFNELVDKPVHATTVNGYLSGMTKKKKILRIGSGMYVSKNYKGPDTNNPKTFAIKNVKEYMELRKRGTRAEMWSFFEKSPYYPSAAAMDNALYSLIGDKIIKRVSRGSYELIQEDNGSAGNTDS